LPATQVLPWQQPFGQEAAVQVQVLLVGSQTCVDEHCTQDAPSLPHAVLVAVVMHLPVGSQQPVGQLVASQVGFAVHRPVLQNCVAVHAKHEPPPWPQDAWLDPSEHWPLASQQPGQLLGPQVTDAQELLTHCWPV